MRSEIAWVLYLRVVHYFDLKWKRYVPNCKIIMYHVLINTGWPRKGVFLPASQVIIHLGMDPTTDLGMYHLMLGSILS